jgi:hypothetical protein
MRLKYSKRLVLLKEELKTRCKMIGMFTVLVFRYGILIKDGILG